MRVKRKRKKKLGVWGWWL